MMIIAVSEFSDESLQDQIRSQLRARILSGELTAGEALPSIRSLARQVKVSVITVQRAYEALAQEHLVQPRKGKGFYVADISGEEKKQLALAKLISELKPLLRKAADEGLSEEEIASAIMRAIREEEDA